MGNKGWIGVDLDGTLARYDGWVNADHIGEPISPMVEMVKEWISDGREVKIFTARVDGGETALKMGNDAGKQLRDVDYIRSVIQDWSEIHIGVRLAVTNVKDYGMIALYDDRCIQVERNTGKLIGGIDHRGIETEK